MSGLRALIVGTGAIGGLYSSRLAKTCNITAVCRSNYDVVKQNGFLIESAKFGNYVFRPNQVVKHVSDAIPSNNGNPFDYIIVTLKALPDVYSVADIIASAVSPQTTVVLIQNGLGIEEPIANRFPNNPIVSAVAYIGCSQNEPGVIHMSGKESLTLGPYPPSNQMAWKQRDMLADLFTQGGVSVEVADDIEKVRWKKLIWNASFSSVCTVHGMNTSQVLKDKTTSALVETVMREVIQAANQMGCEFDEDKEVENMMEKTRVTAHDYKPSMLLDRERNQPLETEVILGTPLRRAKEKGIAVPILEDIYTKCSAVNPFNKA